MKHHLLLLLVLLLCGAFPGFAGEEKSPANIRIEMQVVAVPEELARPLVGDLMDKKKIEAANAKIQDLLDKGTAKLLGWPIAITHSGQRAVVEATREVSYATDYDAPAVLVTQNVNPDQTFTVEPKLDLTHLEGIPTTFETRVTGIRIEVDPVLSPDGKTIDMNLVPQHVRLIGFNKVTIEKPSTGGKIVVEQPVIDVMKVTTSLSLRSGERILVGVYRTDDPPKHIEFFILKAEAIAVE